jgi:hypothetical protein
MLGARRAGRGSAFAVPSGSRRLGLIATLAFPLGFFGCNAIFGIEGGTLLTGAGGDAGQGGAGGGAGGAGGVAGSGGGGGAGGAAPMQCPPFSAPADCVPGTPDNPDHCCAPGRSCLGGDCVGGSCQRVEIQASPMEAEAIGIAVVGDRIFWSSGYGKRLYWTFAAGGARFELAYAIDNSFLTMIATDGERIYFLDYGGPTVRSVPVDGGPITLVAEVLDPPDAQAGFGRITARDGYVYWAMASTGGVFRAPANGTGVAVQIAGGGTFGVAVDDTHVYWSEPPQGVIRRLPLASIGRPDSPETVVSTGEWFGDIVLEGDRIFWEAGGSVGTALKDGFNQQLITISTTEGDVWGVAADDKFVYWTDTNANALRRASRLGEGLTTLAPAEAPWSITHDCGALYWTNSGSRIVHKLAK